MPGAIRIDMSRGFRIASATELETPILARDGEGAEMLDVRFSPALSTDIVSRCVTRYIRA